MTDIQERLLVLLDEIDAVCTEQHLTYFLAEESAISALNHAGFSGSEYNLKIMMPVSQIRVLISEIAGSGKKNRAFESWISNPDLRQLVWRYVDKDSLLIDYSSGKYFRKPGIAVTILPLLTEKLPSQIRGEHKFVQECNMHYRQQGSEQEVMGRALLAQLGIRKDKAAKGAYHGGLYCLLHSRAHLARELAEKYLSAQVAYQYQIRYLTKDTEWVLFDESTLEKAVSKRKDLQEYAGEHDLTGGSIYDEIERHPFEDREYPVPGDRYFICLYGKRWQDIKEKAMAQSDRIRVLQDTGIPYEDFLEFTKEDPKTTKDIMAERRIYNKWLHKVHDPMKKKVDHTFAMVRRSVDRIDCWYHLRDKREALREARRQGDLSAMEGILSDYLNKTDRYAADKIGFYIDDEIFACASEIWKAQGRPEYAEKVYGYVPDLYKTETVEETVSGHQK